MKKIHLEIIASIIFVFVSTFFVYKYLSGVGAFWDSQMFWSVILTLGLSVVSFGYYHQGSIVHKNKSAKGISTVLPFAAFTVQCILFVKGIYYHDWSLIIGAVLVNSGVVFSLYQIFKFRTK